jgi:hypothetical protein
MNNTQHTMHEFLKEIGHCVDMKDKKEVINLINKMKNFYMTEEGLKVKKENPNIESIRVIGKMMIDEMPKIESDKPVRHIFY